MVSMDYPLARSLEQMIRSGARPIWQSLSSVLRVLAGRLTALATTPSPQRDQLDQEREATMTERKSGMTEAQMEAILNEVFRVIMAKHYKRMGSGHE